jgi:hypothetical protein
MLVLLSLLAASCGSSVERSLPAADRMIDALANDAILGAAPRTSVPSEALCIAQQVHSEFGAKRLDDLGVTIANPSMAAAAEKLTPREVVDYVDIVEACTGGALGAGQTTSAVAASDSGQSGQAVEGQVVEEFSNALMFGSDAITTDRIEATCIAERVYDWQGRDGIVALTRDHTMTSETAAGLAGIVHQCLDLEALFIDLMAEESDPIQPAEASCVAAAVGSNNLAWLFADGILGASVADETQDRVDQALLDGFSSCVSPNQDG